MTRFCITSLPRSYQLTQQIWSLHQVSLDPSTYYTKLKTLWDELDGADCEKTCQNCDCCKAIHTKTEHAKIIKFLAGLNESYSTARSQIIMKKNVPDLAEVYNLLDQDYSQHNINPVTNASAYNVATSNSDVFQAAVNATHSATQQHSNRPLCSHCGFSGHTVDECYKIHGYPSRFKSKRLTSDKQSTAAKPLVANMSLNEAHTNDSSFTGLMNNLSKDQIQGVIEYFNAQMQLTDPQADIPSTSGGTITTLPSIAFSSKTLCFAGILRATGNVLSSESWIIDSGATHHVCHDKSIFSSLSDTVNRSVSLPTGLGIKIVGIGQVKLDESMILNNVLYIPDFRLNLLSVSQLTKDLGYRVAFDNSSCVIQDLTKGLTIGQGEEIANLYVLDKASFGARPILQSFFYTNAVVDATLWHNRLGHPSVQKLDSIANILEISNRNKIPSHCAICPLAKQKHLPFDSQNNMCNAAFDLLHIDTWGPFSVSSVEGYRYFLTIVNDHTRVTWIYLLRTKDEVIKVFPEFINFVETQYKTKVKGVRSNNAKELVELFKSKGIMSYHSCHETPQQNSVVERKHQHILNVARSLMFQAKLPLELWSDCVLTAVFLMNRLPSPLLKNKSPYPLLHMKKTDYSGIRVFGCLCYVSTSSKNIH